MFSQLRTKNQFLLHLLLSLAVLAGSLAWAPAARAADPDRNPSPGGAPAAVQPLCPQAGSQSSWDQVDRAGCGRNRPPVYKPSINAWIRGNYLYLEGARFPKKRNMQVQARRGSGGWYRLGTTRSKQNGQVSDDYRLPNPLRRQSRLYVCLKDTTNSKTYCTWAKRV